MVFVRAIRSVLTRIDLQPLAKDWLTSPTPLFHWKVGRMRYRLMERAAARMGLPSELEGEWTCGFVISDHAGRIRTKESVLHSRSGGVGQPRPL